MQDVNKKLNKVTGKTSYTKNEKKKAVDERNKIAAERKKDYEWMDDFFQNLYDLYTFAYNGVVKTIGDKDLVIPNLDNDKSMQKIRLSFDRAMIYGKENGVIPKSASLDEMMSLLKQGAAPIDFVDALAATSSKDLFYEIATLIQLPSRVGDLFETIFPQLFVASDLENFLLPHSNLKGETTKTPTMVGAEWEKDNITDSIIGEVEVNGQEILVGASLKLKANLATSNPYVLPNI